MTSHIDEELEDLDLILKPPRHLLNFWRSSFTLVNGFRYFKNIKVSCLLSYEGAHRFMHNSYYMSENQGIALRMGAFLSSARNISALAPFQGLSNGEFLFLATSGCGGDSLKE